VISVNPRARRNRDHAGDPLDGLVNMFDVGIVLAVAFLLAALSSLHLSSAFANKALHSSTDSSNSVTVSPNQKTGTVPSTKNQVIGQGSKVGSVYRLSNGQLVYVTDNSASTPTPVPTSNPAP
jgi:hypothetical protein